MFETALSKVRS